MHASKLVRAFRPKAAISSNSSKASVTMAAADRYHLHCQEAHCTAHICPARRNGQQGINSNSWQLCSRTSYPIFRHACRNSSCSSLQMAWRPWRAQVTCQAGSCERQLQHSGSSSNRSSCGMHHQHLAPLPWATNPCHMQHRYGSSSWLCSSGSRHSLHSTARSNLVHKPLHAHGYSTASSSSSSKSLLPPAATAISSTVNPYIKHCVKLRESARYRQQQRRLLLVGDTLLTELAGEASSLDVLVLFIRHGTPMPAGVSPQRVITVTDTVMQKLAGLEEAAGVQVVAELALPEYINPASWQLNSPSLQQQQEAVPQKRLQRLLVLEGVQDPGNLGTLLRCAAAFGWDAVWLLPGCCDPFNAKALRASRGAALRWPLAAGTLQELLAVVQQHNMLLLAAHPEHDEPGRQQHKIHAPADASSSNSSSDGASGPLQQQQPPVCLVLGTEGAGLSNNVLAVAEALAIPMSGHMESLNVGVAGAILMFALSEGLNKMLGRLQQLRQVQQ